MPGVQVATILGQAGPVTGDIFNFTSPVITEPVKAAIFFASGDEGGGQGGISASSGLYAVGSPEQLCESSYGQTGQGVEQSNVGHVSLTGRVVVRSTNTNGQDRRVAAVVDGPIPGGLALRSTDIPPGVPRTIPVGAMIFAGNNVEAQLTRLTLTLTQGDTVSFTPDLNGKSVDAIIILSNGDQYDNRDHSGFAQQSVSFHGVKDGVIQSSASQTHTIPSSDAAGIEGVPGVANGWATAATGIHLQGDASRHPETAAPWELGIAMVGGNLEVTMNRVALEDEAQEIGLLFLHLDGDEAVAGLMDTPAVATPVGASGDDLNAVFNPPIAGNIRALLLQTNTLPQAGQDIVNAPPAGSMGVSMLSVDGDAIGHQINWEVGPDADPTNGITVQSGFLNINTHDQTPAVSVASAEIVDNNLRLQTTTSQAFQLPFFAITEPAPVSLDGIMAKICELTDRPQVFISDPANPGTNVVNPALVGPIALAVEQRLADASDGIDLAAIFAEAGETGTPQSLIEDPANPGTFIVNPILQDAINASDDAEFQELSDRLTGVLAQIAILQTAVGDDASQASVDALQAVVDMVNTNTMNGSGGIDHTEQLNRIETNVGRIQTLDDEVEITEIETTEARNFRTRKIN